MTYKHEDFKYIDAHAHFFPPNIFEAIWNVFELKDPQGNMVGWPIKYKIPVEEMVKLLEEKNVKAFTTLNYAHKKGVARYINDWTVEFVKKYKNAIPFGCVWPEDDDREVYLRELFDEHEFCGIKVQPLVQNFYPWDERMDSIYRLIVNRGKWFVLHAGTAPYRNQFVGYKHFIKMLHKFPNMNIIVAHLGAFEYDKFFSLLEKHENLYFDTTMVFIPNNVFRERKAKRPKSEELVSYQDRILYGTDFPNIPYEYERSTAGLLEIGLSKQFYKKIFHDNAKKIFNLK